MIRFCPLCAVLTTAGKPGEECPDCADTPTPTGGVEVRDDDGDDGDPYTDLGGESG